VQDGSQAATVMEKSQLAWWWKVPHSGVRCVCFSFADTAILAFFPSFARSLFLPVVLYFVVACFLFILYMFSENLMYAATAAAVGASAALFLYSKSNNSRPKGSAGPAGNEGPRRYLIGGNWKCNGSLESNEERVEIFNKAGTIPANVDVVLCVPFVHIGMVLAGLRDDIEVGAQNCGAHNTCGAYTGEIGSHQLKDIGCTWVIIGHSERREGFGMAGEPDDLCAAKCKVAIENGLKVMFCVGEKKEERESGVTMKVIAKQMAPLAKVLKPEDWDKVALAYEPVWAIGTGLTATPAMAQDTHAQIRQWVAANVSPEIANATRIQYGGSMKGANAKELLAQPDIDGGLIGGASLQADFFNVINGVSK
jgi:triosephosphate isomerase